MSDADLLIENEALKAHVAALESDVKTRDIEIVRLRAANRRRKLDAKAASPFDRPYDGR